MYKFSRDENINNNYQNASYLYYSTRNTLKILEFYRKHQKNYTYT